MPLDGIAGPPLIHKQTALRDLTTRLNIPERLGRSEPGTVNAGSISGTWLTGGGEGWRGHRNPCLIPATVTWPEDPNPTPRGGPPRALSTHPSLYRRDSQMTLNFLPTFPAPRGPSSHQEVEISPGPLPWSLLPPGLLPQRPGPSRREVLIFHIMHQG